MPKQEMRNLGEGEPEEAIKLSEKEILQHDDLEKVETFDDLDKYIDRYSTNQNWGRGDFKRYQTVGGENTRDQLNTKKDVSELKSRIQEIRGGKTKSGATLGGSLDHNLQFLPGELRGVVKKLLAQENK